MNATWLKASRQAAGPDCFKPGYAGKKVIDSWLLGARIGEEVVWARWLSGVSWGKQTDWQKGVR